MTEPRAAAWRHRADFRAADGVLLVLRAPPAAPPPTPGQPPVVAGDPAEGAEILLALADDGQALALVGHVDLGTGIRTAYGQIAADELDLPMDRVQVVLGDTARGPNQGPTIASTSIQLHAQPLRAAAAQARAWLCAQAAQRWGCSLQGVHTADGVVQGPHGQRLAYGDLVAGGHHELWLDLATPTKPSEDLRLVGQSVPRVDLVDKVTGAAEYVHDLRRPGMLHGRVVRPPYAGLDAGDFVGRSLRAVDEASIAHLPGIVRLVVQGDFIGIVAEREEQAEAAMHALRVDWAPFTPVAPLDDLAQALSAHPSTPRVVHQQGAVDPALAGAAQRLDRSYVWPYQLHASIGPSCAVAEWHAEAAPSAPSAGRTESAGSAEPPTGPDPSRARATVWAGTQNPHVLRADLARLTGLPAARIEVVRIEASGCYGRNGADDVAADALLLARTVGAPVRVQLTRAQEHAWEPKGAAQLMQVQGGLDADGAPLAYNFSTSYPSNGAPTLALLLTGTVPAVAQAFEMGDRTAVPPYAYAHQRITVNDMAPILRASWLRGVSALPNSFAHESYIDELAHAAAVDPVAYRLRHLPDARAAELLRATADKAGWQPHTAPRQQPPRPGAQAADEWLPGQGVAYARYIHSKFPGFGAAWAAWVADVEVNRLTGEVHVQRVVVGHDAGLMVNPKGVEQQVHGNVLQTTSRALKERLPLDPVQRTPAAMEWGAYPILSFREVPVVDVLLMPRPGEAPLGVGESASVPGTAAIANAIFDATGVRLRQPPFTPEVVRAALQAQGLAGPAADAGQGAQAWSGPGMPGHPAALSNAAEHAAGGAQVGAYVGAGAVTGAQDAAQSAGLGGAAPAVFTPVPQAQDPLRRRRSWGAWAGALAAGAAGLLLGALGWRSAIAPVAVADASALYRPELVERGRQLAALGNCISCHTADGGAPGAGGRPVATPFGTVYSSNLTPDAATGIGLWGFSAFQRAMREGLSRDGTHLYPAFPYTAFTQVHDDELQALYAYLMTRPAVAQATPAAEMRFPFNLRPLLAGWKALYLQPGPLPPVPGLGQAAGSPAGPAPGAAVALAGALETGSVSGAVSTAMTEPAAAPAGDPRADPLWQRGARLVNGLGHCGACHTPRDALGGEQAQAYLGGALVKGWEAPALGALSRSPVPWTEAALLQYLQTGAHRHHGVAGGPMAEVVRNLAQVPEADLRAMARYLAQPVGPDTAAPAAPASAGLPASVAAPTPAQRVAQASAAAAGLLGPSQRLFESACGACHHDGDGPHLLGLNQPLALNSNLHSARPDNLIQTILHGLPDPAFPAIGHMPGFGQVFSNQQVADLAAYMRQRFAPEQPAWPELPAAVARVRALGP